MERTKETRACLLVSDDAIRYCTGRGGRILRTGRIGRRENVTEALRAVSELFPEGEAPQVCLLADTDRVCLIPQEWFEREDADRSLALGGIAARPSDELVVTEPVAGIVAAMYVGAEPWPAVRTLFPGARVVHPLQVAAAWRRTSKPSVEAFLCGGRVHLNVSAGGRTICARTQPCRSEADLLYYLNRLRIEYPDLKFRIGICGEGAHEAAKAASRRFPRVSVLRMSSRGAGKDAAAEYLPLMRVCHENY
ncbi:hypothetical protein [uncultured Alistipes sp.]|uniref:hypothetical protein n=1 Tax=uncultured Alistipes sp. TaxID=538949 RepID=UPI00260BD3B5|nr:hypothetical protein [uncultured Alistipes sp.]